MNQKLLVGLTALVVMMGGSATHAQPSVSFDNWGHISAPSAAYPWAPQIDALSFYNHAGATFEIFGSSVYTTSSTVNYTNEGTMILSPGFDFRTYPPDMGVPRRAANFVNRVSGQSAGLISANGSLFLGGGLGGTLFFGNLSGTAKITVDADNIINSGTIDLTAASLLKLTGRNIDLSRGNLQIANPLSPIFFGTNVVFYGLNFLFNAGVLDGYWAAETATNAFNPFANFSGPNFYFTQSHWVTNRNYLMMSQFLFGQTPYVFDWGEVNSNRLIQAVFLTSGFDTNFVNSVYFTPFEIAVQWQYTTPAWPAPGMTTNYFYLTDNFGEVTNIGIRVNGYINPHAYAPTPTYRPINYEIFQGLPYNTNLPAATPGMLPGIWDNGAFTNQYAAYEAIFSAATALPTDIVGGAYSNMPGRIEINAESNLDLHKARISTLNYLRLESTNHFKGSQNASIVTPYADYFLRSTNGSLSISNIISPYVARPQGTCQFYSARWTNVVNNITNCYHVLFVESFLEPWTTPLIANLRLGVVNTPADAPKNLVINDVLHVTTDMKLNAERLTIGLNDETAFSPAGELNLAIPGVLWQSAAPELNYFTNWGTFTALNTVYFGSSRNEPPYNNEIDRPYEALVNHGGITNQGSIVWSKYFENDGTFEVGQGSFVLQNCQYADLSEGFINARFGQVSIAADTLVYTNTVIQSGGALDLTLANEVSDGGPDLGGFSLFFGNRWTANNGFSLRRKAARGDLLGTTVINIAPAYAETLNYWAGEDRGATASGFTDNCAVGRLTLVGGTESSFRFIGTGGANALYVDYLELEGSATNRDAFGNFSGLNIDPNMKIYFAEAVAGTNSIAEKLDGRNGGRLVWVSSYAGAYSSTNLIYPDGNTYTFNRALCLSCNLDSDNDGIANCSDSTPVYVPGPVQLSICITNQPAMAKVLSWPALGNSTNTVYFTSSSTSTNWLVLTNFVFGPEHGTASVLDTATNSTRYYRVRLDPLR